MEHGDSALESMVEILRKVIKQYQTWRPSVATRNILYYVQTKEQKKSYGPLNPDTTYYVIRSIRDESPFYTGPIHNLLANYFYVLSHLKYAECQGWTPIVDQLNYPVYNSVPEKYNGAANAWEYFWKQPCDIPLEEIYRSKRVVLSKQSWFGQWDMGYDVKNYENPNLISQLHLISKQVPLREDILAHINQVRSEVFGNADKILGVCVRYVGHSRTCYFQGAGHPIQPDIDSLIEDVIEICKQRGFEFVFLASEEESSIEKFLRNFGNNLLYLPRLRYKPNKIYNKKNPNKMYEPYQINKTCLEYLTEMELLSKCDGLVGSITSGFRYAVIKNNNQYNYIKIYDCGRFKDPRKL